MLQGYTSARACICNVYMPPKGNLARRSHTEEGIREQAETVLGYIPADVPALLCGDFNARTSSLSPELDDPSTPPRSSMD